MTPQKILLLILISITQKVLRPSKDAALYMSAIQCKLCYAKILSEAAPKLLNLIGLMRLAEASWLDAYIVIQALIRTTSVHN